MEKYQLIESDITNEAKKINIEACVMRAVCEVESSGEGFLSSGKPKILFEGHVFWRELEKRDLDPKTLDYPNILYQNWTRSHYRNDEGEYERLEEAVTIHEEAALCSASWGMFQILGSNHNACGFPDIHDFINAQKESALAQLEVFCAFIQSQNLLSYLQNKQWAEFAKRYNGPSYVKNGYDTKLAAAYLKCTKAQQKGSIKWA